MTEDHELFIVFVFFRDGGCERDVEYVDAKTASDRVKRLTESVGARLGVVTKIIVTDTGDQTVLQWEHGKGIVFPPKPHDENPRRS